MLPNSMYRLPKISLLLGIFSSPGLSLQYQHFVTTNQQSLSASMVLLHCNYNMILLSILSRPHRYRRQ